MSNKITSEIVLQIFQEYSDLLKPSNNDELDVKAIFDKLATKYNKPVSTIKTHIKKHIAKLIYDKTISIDIASDTYKFTKDMLNKSLEFYYKNNISNIEINNKENQDTILNGVLDLQSNDILDLQSNDTLNGVLDLQSNVILNNIISTSNVTNVTNETNIINTQQQKYTNVDINELKDIKNELKELRLIITKQNKQIETSFEIIQKLIHSRDPVSIVEENREKRRIDGTEYKEPIRPPTKDNKKIEISKYDDDRYKIEKCFDNREQIKSVQGSRWIATEKVWVIPNEQLETLTNMFKTSNSAYVIISDISTSNIDIAAIIPDEIEEIISEINIQDTEITADIFL